jgi:hypothetical protein
MPTALSLGPESNEDVRLDRTHGANILGISIRTLRNKLNE